MAFFKPFSCIGILYTLCEWNGISPVLIYMIHILEKSGSSIDAELSPIIIGGIRLITAGRLLTRLIITFHLTIFTFLAILPIFVGKLKPKWLFIIAQGVTTLGFVAMGIYSLLLQLYPNSDTVKSFGWIPFAAIVAQAIMRAGGILPMLHTLMNEMFPTEIRTFSIGITQACLVLSGFSSVKVFPKLDSSIGYPSLCLIYTIIGIVIIIWAYVTVPDNRGKSLAKVEELQEKSAKNNPAFDLEER